MTTAEPQPEPLRFSGSMRAGAFTAQLFVGLAVTPQTLTLSALGRSYALQRQHLVGIEETSILGIFKRGLRFRHSQLDLPSALIFYPRLNRDFLRHSLQQLGWS